MKNNLIYIFLFFLMFALHFVIFKYSINCCETVFIKYYLFLTLLFMMVITIMSLCKKMFPDYAGFIFMGLVFIKLALMFFIIQKLQLSEIPHYKPNFIIPYLVSLTLVTLYSVKLIEKGEKNQ